MTLVSVNPPSLSESGIPSPVPGTTIGMFFLLSEARAVTEIHDISACPSMIAGRAFPLVYLL